MPWTLALLAVAASLGLSSTGPCQAAPPDASQGLRDVTIRLNWYLRGAVQESLDLARANPNAALGATERALGIKDSRIDRAKFDTFLSLVFDSQTPKLGIGYQTASGWQATARTLHTMGQLDDVNIYRQAFWTD